MSEMAEQEQSMFARHTDAFRASATTWAGLFRSKGGGMFFGGGWLFWLFIIFIAVKYTAWAAGAALLLAGWILTMATDAVVTSVRALCGRGTYS